jgi:proteasome lid subunit RPN8/RPN11
VRIRQLVLDAIVAHARDAAPLECCGLLVGQGETIAEAVRARNLRNSETAFQVDPAEHFAVLRRTRAEGRTLLGAYHSHPRSPAVPSEKDIREAFDASLLHLIVSLMDETSPQIQAYRISSGHVSRVDYVPVP